KVADILDAREWEVHRPGEHRAEPLLERLVEARIVPQARPDPHQANALVARGTETLLDALQHLVAEPLCVADSPVRAAVPLRDHSVGHLLGNRDRARPGAADRLRRLP